MAQGQSGFARRRFSKSSRPCRTEASSCRSISPGFCGRCSNRSICRRLRSIKAKPSAKVIVSKFSLNLRTAAEGIKLSSRMWWSAAEFRSSDISVEGITSQVENAALQTRRGQMSVTFLRSICVVAVTTSSSCSSQINPQVVEMPDPKTFPFGYAKETCLSAFLLLPIASSRAFNPLHFAVK